MGRAGYEKTTSLYTWDRVVDRVERVYLDLATKRNPRLSP
jgi:hypothetical protein